MGPLTGAVAALVDLLVGERCAGCGDARGPLCHACADVLARRPHPCQPRVGCPPVWTSAPHSGRHRQVLLAFKERRVRALAGPLGGCLARAVRAAPAPAVPLLVPVPPRPGALRRRGYDPVLLLARAAAAELGGPWLDVRVVTALRHSRRVADQSGLDRQTRRANLAGALTVRAGAARRVRGRVVVVVDDVLTTGATLAEASRALRAAGAHVACAAVLTERR